MSRIRSYLNRGSKEKELREELEFHIESRKRDLMQSGLSGVEAQRAAQRMFGNELLIRERTSDQWGFRPFEDFFQDLRYGWRVLRRSPLFALVAVLSLGLGVGANTAIFSLMDAVLYSDLPVREPGQLYVVGEGRMQGMKFNQSRRDDNLFSFGFFQDLRSSGLFESTAAFGSFTHAVYWDREDGSALIPLTARLVSSRYLDVLGAPLQMGRDLELRDEADDAEAVAVISHRFWVNSLGGNPQILGHGIVLNERRFRVVGVAGPHFVGISTDQPVDLWVPVAQQETVTRRPPLRENRDLMWMRIATRLPEPDSRDQLQEEGTVLLRRLAESELGESYDSEAGPPLQLILAPAGRGLSEFRSRIRSPLLLLFAVVGLVLLIACANLANILLARASRRRAETALRLAVGAGRGRLIRQFLTESLILSVLGAVAGLGLAQIGGPLLLSLISGGVLFEPLVLWSNPRVLGFTLGLAVITAVLFGLVPAFRAATGDLTASVKGLASSPGNTGRAGGLLVIAQVGLAFVVLMSAGLLLMSITNLERIDPGFDSQRLVTVEIDPRGGGYNTDQLPALYRSLEDELKALPNVESVSLSLYGLFSGYMWNSRLTVEGQEPLAREDSLTYVSPVTSGFFETVGIPLRAGRVLSSTDTANSPQVAVVNEALAQRFFGRESPLGRQVRLGQGEGTSLEVVGVVANAKHLSLTEDPEPRLYASADQQPQHLESIQVRVTGRPEEAVSSIRSRLEATAPNLPVVSIRTMSEQVGRTLRQRQLTGRLTLAFSGLALLLSGIGVYGLLAYRVAGRSREIGLRMALGSSRASVQGMVLRDAMKLVAIGTAVGLVGCLWGERFLDSFLYETSTLNLALVAASVLIFIVVGAVAAYLPARNASRVDPMTALRAE